VTKMKQSVLESVAIVKFNALSYNRGGQEIEYTLFMLLE
jgi:hypothetical protein